MGAGEGRELVLIRDSLSCIDTSVMGMDGSHDCTTMRMNFMRLNGTRENG